MVTDNQIATKIQEYLKHVISPAQLVDWAEQSIMNETFEDKSYRDIVAQLGVADVRTFGLTWQDCEKILFQLGYKVNLDFQKVA